MRLWWIGMGLSIAITWVGANYLLPWL